MFTSEDLKQSLQKKEEARQKALERRNKQPVWLTKIQFGNATAYRLEMGRRIMGEKVAFYGYSAISDFFHDEKSMLADALSAGICQRPILVWNKHHGNLALLSEDALKAYERFETRRLALIASLRGGQS